MQPLEPDEVFTPRMAAVNDTMYVPRHEYEIDLGEALRGHRHIILHGESGCGKSWLYKKFFKTENIHYEVANLANAVRLGSIQREIENVISRSEGLLLTGVEDEKKAVGNAVVVSAEAASTRTYEVRKKEPYEAALRFIREQAGKHVGVLVLENLEMIYSNHVLMEELASLIILVDDERYSKYRVKLLMVGVPAGVRDYFNQLPHRGTVANRLVELPEVYGMSEQEADDLVAKGFTRLGLPFRASERGAIFRHIRFTTDRLPQGLHEYCLALAKLARRDGEVYLDLLPEADEEWLKDSVSESYATIQSKMNGLYTNQVLFALGRVPRQEFKPGDVEAVVNFNFSHMSRETPSDTGAVLTDLSKGNSPLLRWSPNGGGFVFTNPKYRTCIRVMLRKMADDSVDRVELKSLRRVIPRLDRGR